ncbi:EAL domain-containing protein [Oscillatoria sp. CS-180]|uniref:EAL domain-containing protein n=1 Tax=Oscillatoria sp. CS-180 TaxID=3021720 RepID=UPI00232C2516|nr:EAL domain-containing protein [Oscillatoria sp. CS-180]MDB9525482.1 EAL domain-containing protein [Oscillatoria sp. CS-180]
MVNRSLSVQRGITNVANLDDAETAASRLKLLVVEDVQEDVELISLCLDAADIDCAIEVADSFENCDSLLSQQTFNAVLADYRLPGLNAFDIFHLVQKHQSTIPFILVTGSLGEESAVECIKAGMTDYVLKDRLYRLPTVLKRALAEAKLKRQQQTAIEQMEQQAWRESVLNRIIQAIRESLILEEVLQATVKQLQTALKVDYCMVVQPSATQQMLTQYVSSSTGESTVFYQENWDLCIHFEEQLRAGQQIELNQANLAIAEISKGKHLQSALVTPLNYQQMYFGALMLCHIHEQRSWEKLEAGLIQAVAEQCAIAIYQANLYAQAQRELEQRRRVEDQLHHDAFHDALTGLPNRALFLDRLNHALQIAHRDKSDNVGGVLGSFAVLFLDLDDFRIVNDSLGHDAGDFLLQVVAARLYQCLRVGDTLARISGDEFAVLLEDISNIDHIIKVVEDIQNVLRESITLESQEISISSCVGIVIDAPNYNNAAQFLRDADTAMYQAKRKGRGSYRVFNWSMHAEVKQRLQLENDLRRAVARDEFHLVYQPIIHLPSRALRGFEALIRWCDPVQGILSPSEFIPVAEQTGLIIPMGQWVIRQSCQQWKQWLQRWPQLLNRCSISVNLSAKQFVQSDLATQIDTILKETGIDCSCLRIEITESALLNNEATSLEILTQLKARRIQVAMDDFGTGYSSLSYLLRFPKDVLKIDKSFVSNLDDSPDNQEIIKTILALGSNLGLDVVAEGIETEHQAQFLLDQGCAFGQGYWFSEPLTSEDADALLHEQLDSPLL